MARNKQRKPTIGASNIGGGGAGGAVAPQIATQPPQITNTAQQAIQQNARTFDATDDSDFHELKGGRNYYLSQAIDINGQLAIINYLSQDPESGTLYSMSQNMNYNMAHLLPLTANQRFVRDSLNDAMHNLGENIYLYRYDHDGMVNSLLAQNGYNGSYMNYNGTQLKNMLVGTEFSENKFTSTSYNDLRHANNPTTFTSRAVKIIYKAKAGTQALMVGNGVDRYGKVDAQGEIVLAPNQKATIVDVRYNGKPARQQGTQSYTQKQIEIIVEIG